MRRGDDMTTDLEEKRGPGRPKKEVEVQFDDLSEELKILYTYKDGQFDAAVCRAIELSKEEFDARCKEDHGFKRLISFGRTLCQAWWEDKYREAANGNGKINASMVNFAMKNVFGWAEKTETTNSDLLAIEGMSRDEAMQKLRELGPNIINLLEAKNKNR